MQVFTFFKDYGIDTLITAIFTSFITQLFRLLSKRYPIFNKFGKALTFVLSIGIFALVRFILTGNFYLDVQTVENTLTAATLSTIISVLVKYFIEHGVLPKNPQKIKALAVKEIISPCVLKENVQAVVNQLIQLPITESLYENVFNTLKEYVTDGLDAYLFATVVQSVTDVLTTLQVK